MDANVIVDKHCPSPVLVRACGTTLFFFIKFLLFLLSPSLSSLSSLSSLFFLSLSAVLVCSLVLSVNYHFVGGVSN